MTAVWPSVCADLIILLGDPTPRHMHGHKLARSLWEGSGEGEGAGVGGRHWVGKCTTANKMEDVERAVVDCHQAFFDVSPKQKRTGDVFKHIYIFSKCCVFFGQTNTGPSSGFTSDMTQSVLFNGSVFCYPG